MDIENKKFYEYKWLENTVQCRSLDYRMSLIAQNRHNQLVLGLQGGIARYNLDSKTFCWLMDVEKELPKHRSNDGKVDSKGRLWLGTLQMDFQEGAGSLYCVDENLLLSKKKDKCTIANGLAWSPDNTRLYFIDSPTHKIQCFLFDSKLVVSGDIEPSEYRLIKTDYDKKI